MKIEICYTPLGLGYSIVLTKKDIEERTWAKYKKVELIKKQEGTIKCLMWGSPNHDDSDEIIGWDTGEYQIVVEMRMNRGTKDIKYELRISKEEFEKLVKELENDSEWKETIENLKRFAEMEALELLSK